jgi:tRNA(Arg) A34 adenosine deaminase TadA
MPITCHRRDALFMVASGALVAAARDVRAETHTPAQRLHFIAEAERMRREAVAAGDQSYGAIVVKGDTIVGWGPSRLVTSRNVSAHAERVAVWDARARLGVSGVKGAVMYSTSRPCGACEAAAAQAGVVRMYWGAEGRDAGVPGG